MEDPEVVIYTNLWILSTTVLADSPRNTTFFGTFPIQLSPKANMDTQNNAIFERRYNLL